MPKVKIKDMKNEFELVDLLEKVCDGRYPENPELCHTCRIVLKTPEIQAEFGDHGECAITISEVCADRGEFPSDEFEEEFLNTEIVFRKSDNE